MAVDAGSPLRLGASDAAEDSERGGRVSGSGETTFGVALKDGKTMFAELELVVTLVVLESDMVETGEGVEFRELGVEGIDEPVL